MKPYRLLLAVEVEQRGVDERDALHRVLNNLGYSLVRETEHFNEGNNHTPTTGGPTAVTSVRILMAKEAP